MKTGTWAIIQARTGSTRLPGKVFLKLKGKPLIWHVVERLKGSREIDGILLATTENPNDQKLETWAVEHDVPVFRGSEADVLSRYYHAAQSVEAGTIVRITADDPFKDHQVMDRIIRFYRENQLDFAYNNNPATYPEGLDVEVFSFEALEKAHRESKEPFEREHVTQYFYR
ncbi:MAG: NTP transferase domain-containing protein, partial [bacterium]|nr:NTP transferase domain-containing protein [bacterium]